MAQNEDERFSSQYFRENSVSLQSMPAKHERIKITRLDHPRLDHLHPFSDLKESKLTTNQESESYFDKDAL